MASSEPVSLSDLLKRYRINAGLTQEELAERAGLSARGIRALESQTHRAPRKDTLVLLESALGLTKTERDRLESAVRQRRAAPQSSAHAASAFKRAHMPLVGRERECALLDQHLTSESTSLLLFAGEPGIGKSRLLEEAAERAEILGWTILTGGCSRRSAEEPYAPCVETLARFLATRGAAQRRLDLHGCAWLARLLPELAEQAVAPALAWTLPPQQERRLMFAAVARLLANVAGSAGTLLVLDDLQWAGDDALDLLAFLLRGGAGGTLRIVGAYRDTDVVPQDPLPILLGDLAREGLATWTALAPLEPDAAAQLFTNLLGDGHVESGEAQRQILLRAGGVPFYLVSCAQAARTGAFASGAEPFSVPWSVAASIRQRVSLLTASARDVLGVAAVIERRSPRDLLLLVCEELGYREDGLLRALEETIRARLLVEGAEGTYAFAHDLICETVNAELSGARRAMLHRRVAEALERLSPGEKQVAELAWHFARGENLARALPYALRAGEAAEAIYAHREAALHYRTAAEWAQRIGDRARAGEALEKQSDALFRLARYADAYACLEGAIRIYREDGNWERLAWSTAQIAKAGDPLGRMESSMARLEELLTTLAAVADGEQQEPESIAGAAVPLVRQAERAVSLLTPKTAARLYLCLTTRFFFLRRYDEVYEAGKRAIYYARTAGDVRIESVAHAFRGAAQQAQGQIEAAAVSVACAHERAIACGDLEARYIAADVEATIFEIQAQPLRARETRTAMLETATQLGDVSYLSETYCALALIAFSLGDWEQSAGYFARYLLVLQEEESASWRLPAVGLAVLDVVRAEHGEAERPPSALPSLPSLTESEDAAETRVEIWAAGVWEERDLLVGGAAGALVRLRRAMAQDIQGGHIVPASVDCLRALLAWAQMEHGDCVQARETLAEARELANLLGNRAALVDIARIEGLVALREGRLEVAQRSLEESVAMCHDAPYPYAEAKAHYVYGQIHAAAGRQAAAREEFARALAICERLSEQCYRPHIERALARVPVDAM